MSCERTCLVVVRHGERLDEVSTVAWRKLRAERPELSHDPPLTRNGWSQAAAAGKAISTQLQVLPSRGNLSILSSPTSRTLSTAASVACELGVPDITPVYALNCCAAAQSRGVDHDGFSHAHAEAELGGVALSCWPPSGDAVHVNDLQRQGGFATLVKELAAEHEPGSVIVLVTHREGIWELQCQIGVKHCTRYCSVDYIAYDHETDRISTWFPEAAAFKLAPPPKLTTRVRTSTRPASEQETVVAMLAQGSGTLVLRRSEGAVAGTLLWQTPGVRGVWVEGGPVPNGEAVELLCSPQESENGEGDFVRVRRANGIEGWTKVKNLSLSATSKDSLEGKTGEKATAAKPGLQKILIDPFSKLFCAHAAR